MSCTDTLGPSERNENQLKERHLDTLNETKNQAQQKTYSKCGNSIKDKPKVESSQFKQKRNIKEGSRKAKKTTAEEGYCSTHEQSNISKENSRVITAQGAKHQKAKSISGTTDFVSRPKKSVLNTGYLGDASDRRGDEEPTIPTVIHLLKSEIKESQEISVCKPTETKSEECKVRKRCLCGCSKPKTDTNLSSLTWRKEKDPCNQSAFSIKENEELENKSTIQPLNPLRKNRLSLPEAQIEVRLRTIVSNSTRTSSCDKTPHGLFPRLNAREENTSKDLRTNNKQNLEPSLSKKDLTKPAYLQNLNKKARGPASLDISACAKRASSVQNRRYHANRFPRSQPLMDDSIENSFQMVSKLLGPIANDFKSLKSYIRPNQAQRQNDAASMNLSDMPEKTVELGNVRVRTPKLKQGNSLINSNSFVRSMYRVKKDKYSSEMNLNSEEDLNMTKEDEAAFNIPSLQNDLCEKEADNVNEDKPQKEQNKSNISLKMMSNRVHNRANSIQIESQISKTSGLSEVRTRRGKEDLSNLSVIQSGNFDTRRNRSVIQKLNKDWEEHKKNFERESLKDGFLIQFQSTGNPVMPRSKGIAFERTGKKSLFEEVVQTPGPASYRIDIPRKKKGFAFGRTKKLDMTGLPLVEDVNKMLDPVRRLSRGF